MSRTDHPKYTNHPPTRRSIERMDQQSMRHAVRVLLRDPERDFDNIVLPETKTHISADRCHFCGMPHWLCCC